MAACWNSCGGIGRKCAFYNGFARSVPAKFSHRPYRNGRFLAPLQIYFPYFPSSDESSSMRMPSNHAVPVANVMRGLAYDWHFTFVRASAVKS